jgi:hypothetical protein
VRSNLFRKLSEPVVKFPILHDRVSKGEFLFFFARPIFLSYFELKLVRNVDGFKFFLQ